MQISLGKLLVFAPDLVIAREFYGDVLGLSLTESTDTFLGFRGVDFELLIFDCDTETTPDGHSSVAGSALTFSVSNLEEAIESLRRSGTRVLHDEPQQGPHSRYIAFSDPFGTVHELVEVQC